MLFLVAYIYQENSIHMVTEPLHWSISQPVTDKYTSKDVQYSIQSPVLQNSENKTVHIKFK